VNAAAAIYVFTGVPWERRADQTRRKEKKRKEKKRKEKKRKKKC